jgi:uncharacterized protein
MKRRFLALSVLIFFSVFTLQAQLFWKISGKDLSKSSYLFGTHHLIEKEQIPHFDKVIPLCEQSDAVVGEMDMQDPNLQSTIMSGAMMKDKKMKDLVSDSDYVLADSEFKALMGVGMDVLGGMKPMMLMTLYESLLFIKESGLAKQPEAVDGYFQKLALNGGKKVLSLETTSEQVDILFDKIPLERQAVILMALLRDKNKCLIDIQKMNKAYLTGDLKMLLAQFEDDQDMTEQERNIIVNDRNQNWINKLPGLMKTQSCFVAVGCLHLVGEKGLINQLRKLGYEVEPVVL